MVTCGYEEILLMEDLLRPHKTALPSAAVMDFAATALQNATPAAIHSVTIRSGLSVASALHWSYGAELSRKTGAVQHFFCCSS